MRSDHLDQPPETPAGRRRGRPPGRSHLSLVISEAFLRREYAVSGRSSTELAAELGCSHKTVLRYLDRYDIPTRRRGQRRAKFPELHSVSFLHARHVLEGRTATDIAADLGCSRKAVVVALRAAGISPVCGPSPLTAEYLTAAYLGEGRSTLDIAAEIGCGPATVARHLRRHGIALRTRGGSGRRARAELKAQTFAGAEQ